MQTTYVGGGNEKCYCKWSFLHIIKKNFSLNFNGVNGGNQKLLIHTTLTKERIVRVSEKKNQMLLIIFFDEMKKNLVLIPINLGINYLILLGIYVFPFYFYNWYFNTGCCYYVSSGCIWQLINVGGFSI